MKSNYYIQFENQFRGDRKDIIKNFLIYESLIKLTVHLNENPKFLDIGCGRGEWLEKWQSSFNDCIGIERDRSMVEFCRKLNLNILDSDALIALKTISTDSISVITIFHMIEHLDNNYLYDLIAECYRVLSPNGLLIIETPSIDNLLVSSKLFYIDSTHINHINPDGFSYTIQNIGFSNVKYFYIHPGPLEKASPIKLTRILNGVSQDVCFVATKSKSLSKIIFERDISWQMDLKQSIHTLEAASEYDLELEKQLSLFNHLNETILVQSSQIKKLTDELILLRSQLNILLKFLFFMKFLLKLIKFPIKVLKKIIVRFFHFIFKILARYQISQKLILSNFSIYWLNFFVKYIIGSSSKITKSHVRDKINKLFQSSPISTRFNDKLRLHYESSIGAQAFRKFLNSKLFHKNK